jgi:HK97 family phage major capsid protein
MISTYLTASGGTESSPTINETNIATAAVDLACFDITSGYQKVSFQELRDAHASVNLVDKIAKANSNSHARKIENDIINGTGNGTTGVQGLMAVDNALPSVASASFGLDDLEDLYYSVPQQYRGPACWLVNDATAKVLRQELKDTTGRSLFDRNVVDGVEWDTMLGKRFYVSEYMDDDVILFFNPEFYMLRTVEGQIFQQFTEKFFPHSAWAGIMSFGGAWLGPTGANGAIHSLTITS